MPIKEIIPMRVKRLYPNSKIPTRGSNGAAGYDLYAENIRDFDDSIADSRGIATPAKVLPTLHERAGK